MSPVLLRVWCVAVVLWGVVAPPARSELVFSNLGPGDSWDRNNAYVVNGAQSQGTPRPYWPAMPFTPSFDAILTSLELPLGHFSGTNRYAVELRGDAGGLPGAVLESFVFTNLLSPFSPNQMLSVAVSTVHPLLEAGSRYWVAAVPGAENTSGGWNWSSPLQRGGNVASLDGGQTWTRNPFGRTEISAFRVNGDASGPPPAIPEPATIVLLGTGALCLLGYRWRRGRASVAEGHSGTGP